MLIYIHFFDINLYINGNASKEYLFILTDQLMELGYKIYEYRANFIDLLNSYVEENFYISLNLLVVSSRLIEKNN